MVRALLIVLSLSIQAAGQGWVCAEGGGNAGKGAWADEVFGWMVEKGNHGKVVIIGAVPIEGEDSRVALFRRLGASDVTPMVVTQENADKQETYDTIAAASVVFIRGGDQSRYVNWWKGTKTQAAIEAVFKKGGVVGGTSAGCAVLGEVDYDAKTGGLSPREALADGRHENLTLTTGFLDFVPGVLFDTHFTERGRLARLPVMLAHCTEDLKKPDILGIGVDPRTAVCAGPDGTAEIRGEGTATFLRLTPTSAIALEKGKPPTVTGIAYTQVCAGYRYDLKGGEFSGRPDAVGSRHREPDSERTLGRTLISGDDPRAAGTGSVRLSAAPADAWLTSGVGTEPADGPLVSFVVTPLWLAEKAAANSVSGSQLALAGGKASVAALLDEGSVLHTAPPDALQAASPAVLPDESRHVGPARSVLVLDARAVTHAGAVRGARVRPVLEGGVLHLIGAGWCVDLTSGTATKR